MDYKSEIKNKLTGVPFEHELSLLLDMRVTRLVIDELEIVYCDVKRVRRLTGAGWLKDRACALPALSPTSTRSSISRPSACGR